METQSIDKSMSGFLSRKRFLGFYSKRFCQLVGQRFNVFKDETRQKIDIVIDITPQTSIEMMENEKMPRFRILQPNGDNEIFECENNDLMMRWVLALRGCTFVNPDISMAQFNILAVLGRGYYGKVMLCENKTTKEIYAIKTIHKSRLIQSNKVHTVIAERNILTKAQHPFIVSLKFAFQTPSKFYLGLEYAPGGELFFHMQKRGNLPLIDVRLYIAEICLAIDHLHKIGIIYRDLKPENVLLDAEGHVKLTDFGLSKDLNYACSTTTFCGTSEYLAPEIVRREPYTFAVDWWAIGILTYELLFGVTPFAHPNRARLFQNILEKDPVFPPSVSPEVLQFITTVLNKDPLKRPGFEQIKTMPFFGGMNFDDVLQKKIKPYFVPHIDKITKPTNFDKEFTQEAAQDSFVMPVFGSAEKFAGFSYVDQALQDSSESNVNENGEHDDQNQSNDDLKPSSLRDSELIQPIEAPMTPPPSPTVPLDAINVDPPPLIVPLDGLL